MGEEEKEKTDVPKIGGVNYPLIMQYVVGPVQNENYESDYSDRYPRIAAAAGGKKITRIDCSKAALQLSVRPSFPVMPG